MNEETRFKLKVLADLKSLEDTWVFKTQEVAVKGIPDVLACSRGKFVAIELKIEGEKPEPIQEYRLEEIRRAGGIAFWTTPKSWSTRFAVLKGMLERI